MENFVAPRMADIEGGEVAEVKRIKVSIFVFCNLQEVKYFQVIFKKLTFSGGLPKGCNHEGGDARWPQHHQLTLWCRLSSSSSRGHYYNSNNHHKQHHKQHHNSHHYHLYLHHNPQVNWWFPFTPVSGSNSLFIESRPGAGDFEPVQLQYGQVIIMIDRVITMMMMMEKPRCWDFMATSANTSACQTPPQQGEIQDKFRNVTFPALSRVSCDVRVLSLAHHSQDWKDRWAISPIHFMVTFCIIAITSSSIWQ